MKAKGTVVMQRQANNCGQSTISASKEAIENHPEEAFISQIGH
jgi:hypothetical protein